MRWTIGICIGVLGGSVLGCNLSSIKDLGVPCSDVEGIKLESGMCILQNKDGNIEELCEGCNEIDKNLCHKYISNGVFEFNRCPPEYVCSTVKSGGELAANASFCSLRRGDDALSCTSEQIYICDKEGNSTCERSCQYCDPQYMCYRIVGTEDGGEKCENAERKCDEDKSYLCVNGQWEDNAECAYGCNTKKGWCNTCLEDANICTADHKCARNGECVEKTCLDDPAICQPSQKCNADGKCVAKTCLEDASICKEDQKCRNDGVCVAKTCLDDASICKNNEKCRNDGVCVDMDYCEVQSHRIICENGFAWVCKDNKRTKETCADGKECKEGQGCVDRVQDGECFVSSDCAFKGADYICNETHQCEKKSSATIDPCAGVECVSGTCDRGVCVTDDMKARKAGESCDPGSFQTFCNGDKTMECTPGGKIVSDDCVGDNIGKCTMIESFGKKYVACSGNEDMLARCAANEASDSPKAMIDVCYGSQDWAAKVICVTDVAGRPAVYPHRIALDCEGKACGYGDDGQPVCEN